MALIQLAASSSLLRNDQILLAYPNAGCEYDADVKDWNGKKVSREELCDFAKRLRDAGCKIVGGIVICFAFDHCADLNGKVVVVSILMI